MVRYDKLVVKSGVHAAGNWHVCPYCTFQAQVLSAGYIWVLCLEGASWGTHTLGTFQMYPFFRPPSTTSGILCNVNAKNGTSRCCSLVQGSVRLSFLDAAKWAVICTLIFNMIKYYKLISSQSAVRMPVQAMHHERFSKHFLQLFSVQSLHEK